MVVVGEGPLEPPLDVVDGVIDVILGVLDIEIIDVNALLEETAAEVDVLVLIMKMLEEPEDVATVVVVGIDELEELGPRIFIIPQKPLW